MKFLPPAQSDYTMIIRSGGSDSNRICISASAMHDGFVKSPSTGIGLFSPVLGEYKTA
jgi:hypothetical protein